MTNHYLKSELIFLTTRLPLHDVYIKYRAIRLYEYYLRSDYCLIVEKSMIVNTIIELEKIEDPFGSKKNLVNKNAYCLIIEYLELLCNLIKSKEYQNIVSARATPSFLV